MTRRILLGLSTFFLIIFVYEGAVRMLLQPVDHLPSIFGGVNSQTLILVLFSLTHALYALGWRHTLVFFASSAVISWAFEQVGVATGAIYGPYHYTDVLGVKLGHVPLLIPLAWFMMIYPSYVIANLIADDRPIGSRGSLKHIVWLSFLSAAVMTAWDLVDRSGAFRPQRQSLDLGTRRPVLWHTDSKLHRLDAHDVYRVSGLSLV